MKLDTLHSINGAKWQESNGKNGVKQYRLTGKASGQKTIFGHRIESQAAIIDSLLLAGRFTIEDMAVNAKYKSGKIAVSRVRQHLYQKLVKKLGIDVIVDSNGIVYAANVKESADNYALLQKNKKAAAEAAEQARVKHVRRMAAYAGMKKKKA